MASGSRIALGLVLFVLPACSPSRANVKHLGPAPQPAEAPKSCRIAGVVPNSPAARAGLTAGDTLQSVNGTQPQDALAVSDLVDQSPADATFQVLDANGKSRVVKVKLNKEKPRLGMSCDLTGWSKNSVSAAGNEAITVFNGPYALTASGIIDKGMAFMRIRLSNHSDRDLAVHTGLFTVEDGQQHPAKLLTPEEVLYFMHGKDAVPMLQKPDGQGGVLPVPADSVVRQNVKAHKEKEDWSRSDEMYVKSNADYLSKETLWPTTIGAGKVADGLIYFIEPKSLPITLRAVVEQREMKVVFGQPQPSTARMSAEELIQFFEAQKKGTALRLTLKNGKVFVGRFNSYDALNEIVWFDTPSGVLLTTSSFGLKHITHAEAMTPDVPKK